MPNQERSEEAKPVDTKHRRTLIGLQASKKDEEGNRQHRTSEEIGRKTRKEHCVYERTVELETCHDRNI